MYEVLRRWQNSYGFGSTQFAVSFSYHFNNPGYHQLFSLILPSAQDVYKKVELYKLKTENKYSYHGK